MEEYDSRTVYMVDCQDMRCAHCGYCNEITRKLIDIETHWIEADLVEFCCTKCGEPSFTSQQLKQGREQASAAYLR